MTLKLRADLLERAKKFTADIAENGKIFYMLHPEGGAFVCTSNEFFDENQRPSAVIPIWSFQYLPYAKKFADNLEVQEISYEEFCYQMLPAMVQERMIIGLNWDHQGFGVEIAANELYEKIFDGVYDGQYSDLSAEIIVPEEEELSVGKYDSLLGRKNKLEQSRNTFETQFLTVEKVPNPWKLYLQTDSKKTDKAHFCLGKKGIGAECKLIYLECPTPVSYWENLNFNELWNSLEPVLSLENPLYIEKMTVQTKNGELQGIIISTQKWTPVYGWFTANKHSNWHFVFKSMLSRKKGDIDEIKKFLREVFVINN